MSTWLAGVQKLASNPSGGTGFFFDNWSLSGAVAFVFLVFSLMLLNEIARRYKAGGVILLVLVPIAVTVGTIWSPSPSAQNPFGVVKMFSALAGCWIFMAIRYIPKCQKNKVMLTLPAIILAINIAEAVFVDFETYVKYIQYKEPFYEQAKNLYYHAGYWNILNGIAGILLILTISGWSKIKVSNKKSKDMVWADMQLFWIIAYDIWNVAYCYNNISNRALYSGVALILSCTITELMFRRGAWLQHRAITLALFAMFSVAFDYASESWGMFTTRGTNSPASLGLLSILSIIANVAMFIYAIRNTIKFKKNPLKDELYDNTKEYKKILEVNELA
ncbi:MAG: DUF5692 family protein [Treponemataceae bacterium]